MKKSQTSYIYFLFLFVFLCFLVPTPCWPRVPVPSVWRGEIAGRVYNKVFRLPVTIEIKGALPYEKNPIHIFIGTRNPKDIGHLYLTSAQQFRTSRGPVTLKYLSISLRGRRLQATLTNTHGGEAAKVNGFTGPNVSAEQASNLMKGILRDAWGPSEMFALRAGATLIINFYTDQLNGSIRASGTSYTDTSSVVNYGATIRARRVR